MLGAKTRGWVVVETADLRIRSDARPSRAVELASRYQRMHDAIAEHELPCGFDRLTAPIEVTLYEQMGEVSLHRSPQTSLLGLQAQIVIHTADQNASLGLFSHELTHRLLAVCFPTATTWLHEGMATFYETARLDGDTLELGFPPYVFAPPSFWSGTPQIAWTDVNGRRIMVLPDSAVPGVGELRAMNRTDFYGSDPRTKATHYAAAWALVHLLKTGDLSLSPPFIRYLEALHEGTQESVAWWTSFEALNLPERYQSYLSEHHFARVRSIRVAEPEGLIAQPMSRGEAALMLAQLETWNDEKGAKRAEAYIEFAGEQDSTRLAATLLRGAFLKARGDDAGALRWVQRALEQDEADPDALAAMLQLQMSEAATTKALSPRLDGWLRMLERNARSSYHFAVAAWWRTYAAHDARTGIALAERAIELDGSSFLAYVCLGDGWASLGGPARALGAYLAALALSRNRGDEARDYLEERVQALRTWLARSEASSQAR
jgi:tetratricopeptide (TPR) repeat protein